MKCLCSRGSRRRRCLQQPENRWQRDPRWARWCRCRRRQGRTPLRERGAEQEVSSFHFPPTFRLDFGRELHFTPSPKGRRKAGTRLWDLRSARLFPRVIFYNLLYKSQRQIAQLLLFRLLCCFWTPINCAFCQRHLSLQSTKAAFHPCGPPSIFCNISKRGH